MVEITTCVSLKSFDGGTGSFFLRDTVLLLISNCGEDCWKQLQRLPLGSSCSNSFYSKGDWQVLNIHLHSGSGKIIIGQVCQLSRHMWDAIKPKFYPWLDLHKPLLCLVVHFESLGVNKNLKYLVSSRNISFVLFLFFL